MSHVFVSDLTAAVAGSHITLDSDESHHAVRVRRVRIGEQVELVDGLGTRATGTVSSVGKSECAIEVGGVANEPSLTPRLTVVQALVKRDRSDQAMELLTEAGVDTVVPWAAARSQSSDIPAKWPRIATESSKQSRRARFPVIAPAHSTTAVGGLIAETVAAGGLALLCHESARTPIADVISASGALSEVVIVVGPEGGLTDEELAAFTDAGAQPVIMGPSVMRAATAGAAAACIVSALTNRWRGGSPR